MTRQFWAVARAFGIRRRGVEVVCVIRPSER
jgi:hypothetical protein